MGVLYDDVIRAFIHKTGQISLKFANRQKEKKLPTWGRGVSKNWKNVSKTVMEAPLENIFTLKSRVLTFVTKSKILFLSKGHTT